MPAIKEVLTAIAKSDRLPCRTCGKVHTTHPVTVKKNTKENAYTYESWADKDDGHSFYPMDAAQYAATALKALDEEPNPQELLDWLVLGLGYPYNGPMSTKPEFPKAWRRELARTWWEHEDPDGETLDDYLWSCSEEGGWTND